MESFSEIVKQLHNCTDDNCCPSHTEPESTVYKTTAKSVKDKEELEETYQEDNFKYSIHNVPRFKESILKPRKNISRTIRKVKVQICDEITMYDQDNNFSNSIPIKKENLSKMPYIPKVKPESMRKLRQSTIDGDKIWIYAHDSCSSTKGVDSYFEKAQKYLDEFKKSAIGAKNIIYLLWNHNSCLSAEKTNLQTINQIYQQRVSYGIGKRNSVASISKWIYDNGLQDKMINLWLITAKEIDQNSVKACKSLNIGINYKSLTLVTINEKIIDNSVAFAFLSTDCVITIIEETDKKQSKICLKTKSFDFSKINYLNFLRKYELLLNYVICIYTINYKKLDITVEEKREIKDEIAIFVGNLEKKKLEILEEYRELQKAEITDVPKIVEETENMITRKMDAVIDFIHNPNKNSLSFPALKKLIKRKTVDEKSTENEITN